MRKLFIVLSLVCLSATVNASVAQFGSASFPPPGGLNSTNTWTGGNTFNGAVVFNENSGATGDFRLESDSDASIFFVDYSSNTIGFGTSTPDFHVDIHHTADESGDITLHIEHDINSNPGTAAFQIDLIATLLGAEEEASGVVVSIDTANSVGGEIDAFTVTTVGTGSADPHALRVAAGIEVIEQDSGSFANVGFCEVFDDSGSSFTDCVTAASSASTDISLFVDDDDIVYIGNSAKFSAISFDLATGASGGGIKPTFQHSITGDAFTTFVPLDTTSGMHESGVILMDLDVIGDDWVTATVDGDSAFWVRITRTRNNLQTVPIENLIQLAVTDAFEWAKNGDLSIKSMTLAGGMTASTGTFSGTLLFGILSNAAPRSNVTPTYTFQQIVNTGSSPDELCISTGTASATQWVLVSNFGTACSN